MQEGNIQISESLFNSYLSFRPLVTALKKNITEGNPGMQKLYGHVVQQFESHPELLNTITDMSVVYPHTELIEELLSAVFPPTTANFMYGVALPFKFRAVYVSPRFKTFLLKPNTNEIQLPPNQVGESLNQQRLRFAYGLVLKKYIGFNSPDTSRLIYPYADESTGLTRYMEMRLDGRFIDVHPIAEMPELPTSIVDPQTNRVMTLDELMALVPLDKFVFEGVTVMRVNDVTEEAVITEMKNMLLGNNTFLDSSFQQLEKHVQSLVGLKDLTIGVTPFFKINGHYVYSDLHNNNSILFKHCRTSADKDEISDYSKLLFRDNSQPVLFDVLDEQTVSEVQSLQYYYKEGARSLIICPLRRPDGLIGMLEILSRKPGELKPIHSNRVSAAIPLFTLGLEKSLEMLNSQVDTVIKKKFTAVQPAVEWKFTDVALNYIVNKHVSEDAHIERIAFPEVFPLYGAIDIRNSSTERAHSIQLDLVEQLELARKVVKKAQAGNSFPLLQEIEYKIDKFIASASDVLKSEEEMSIQDFMQGQIVATFNHLHSSHPSVKNEVEKYFASLDPQLGMLYHHRKEYEDSVSRINETLARFIDREQAAAQKVYPHYFERYVTDGLDFNIYMGQSISPRKKFDEIYLRNMKMWQLTILTKAARATHALEKELSHPLRTTQLILCFSQPLSITFRTEERKFDVDGAYNIRYEIIKKRIDKVRIRETNERLTQPGKIAIVYTQARDAAEYIEYIEFLQNKNLLKPGYELHDLEELQGVVGLKALRVDINFDDQPTPPKVELSSVTSQQLLGGK